MASNTFDIIVIGVGGMGAAACYHAAKRGLKVLGIEQYDIPHGLGASHGHTRMTRTAYYEHPNYVPMIRRANVLWRELEAETETSLLHQVGGIYMGERGGELIAGSLASANAHGIQHELLDHQSLRQRFDIFQLPENHVGFFEKDAGYLLVEQCTSAHVQAALMRGARIHARERVLEIRSGTVRTDRGEYSAGEIIVCAGPWAGKLLGQLNVHLHVTRQQLAWFWPASPEKFRDIPVWAIGMEQSGLYYGFPMRSEVPGFKLAHHFPADPCDPDTVDRETTAPCVDELTSFLRQFIPAAAGDVLAVKTCLYGNSPDHHFILGRDPSNTRITLAAGFSGHGYKFASAIGELLVELAMDRRTKLDIGWLSPERLVKR